MSPPFKVSTIPIVSYDLGGELVDASGARAGLEAAGFVTSEPAEQRLWRGAYRAARQPIIEVPLPDAEVDVEPRQRLASRSIRIHPSGVIAVRFVFDRASATVVDAWELNERIADRRDVEAAGEADLDGAVHLWETMGRVRHAVAPHVRARPGPTSPSSLNTLQIVREEPDDDRLRQLLDEFTSVQGGSTGLDGRPETSPHLTLRRWRAAAFAHFRHAGQTLLVTTSDRIVADFIAVYERAHVNRVWLRAWINSIESVEIEDLAGRILTARELRSLAGRQLALANLRQRISSALVAADDRLIPADSNIARQATVDMSDALDLDGWRGLLQGRLAALQDRTDAIAALVDREYQEVTRLQGVKLELLFAGSFAASLTALVPALLALAGWGRPALPWVAGVVGGTAVIWAVVVVWSARYWRVSVSLAPQVDDR
jgi:hypothetical protein